VKATAKVTMDTTKQLTNRTRNVKSIARRWATAGTGSLLVAVAGYAAITGPANGGTTGGTKSVAANAPIAAAVASVARDAFASGESAMGAIVSTPPEVNLVSGASTPTDSSTFSTFSVTGAATPTTPNAPKAAPAATPTETSAATEAAFFTPTTQPSSTLTLTSNVFEPTTQPTTQPTSFVSSWADAGLPADWSDAVADDIAEDFHDAKPADEVKGGDNKSDNTNTVTWEPTRSGSGFSSQNAPAKEEVQKNPETDTRVGDASPNGKQGPATPDTKGTPWTPAKPDATKTVAAAEPAAPAKPKTGMVTSGLDSAGKITLTLNHTAELKTNSPVKRVSIGQPDIADVQPFNTNMILVTAKKPGTTQVIVWDENDKSQSIDVSVEIPLDQLKDLIAKVAPGATVEVAVANDQIVLRGQAPNLTVAKQVSDLAGAYGRVQNFIEVAGAQTVAVQVQFAEVSRSVTNDLGVSWAYQNGTSIFGTDPSLSGKLGFRINDDGVINGASAGSTPGQFNIFGIGSVSGNPFAYFIKALRDNKMLRILQEPTLTTTSGEAASFLAGGQVPVPVPADNGQVAIEYKEFGVRLKLTPVVLGNGKIRLVMEAESSELDYANGTTISGAAVPGLRTRRVQNTVELGEGQTISVAGLLDDSVTATKRSVPLLGDIPVLGQLFRSTNYQRRETELVVLITPRLAGAMNPDQVTPLPGSGWRHPNELEQFAFGDLGGNAEADAVKDWGKPASERGLKPGETQKNTTRAQEPAAITRNQPKLAPPPVFVGDHGFVPPEPDTYSTARD
jgi:pilus assembly protein CpaC